jgi:hypothetical protein
MISAALTGILDRQDRSVESWQARLKKLLIIARDSASGFFCVFATLREPIFAVQFDPRRHFRDSKTMISATPARAFT